MDTLSTAGTLWSPGLASWTCATYCFDPGRSNLICLTARTYPPSSNDGVSATPDSTTTLSPSSVLSQRERVCNISISRTSPLTTLHPKGTLLNRLFGTTFDVMDETMRQQTTKGKFLSCPLSNCVFELSRTGIWMCKGKGMSVMVMDVEGTDGRERGEDQVWPISRPFVIHIDSTIGFRAQICTLLPRFLGSFDHQLVGTPSRSLPRCQHGPAQDRLRSQPWLVWKEGPGWSSLSDTPSLCHSGSPWCYAPFQLTKHTYYRPNAHLGLFVQAGWTRRGSVVRLF